MSETLGFTAQEGQKELHTKPWRQVDMEQKRAEGMLLDGVMTLTSVVGVVGSV